MIDLVPLFGSRNGQDAPVNLAFRVFPKSGRPRWMLETRFRKPWYLKTWPRASLKAKVVSQVLWAVGMVGLHLPSRKLTFQVFGSSPYSIICSEFDHVGIFLGTPGPNRKLVVYAERPGCSVFVKIPSGALSAELIRKEANAIELLSHDRELAKIMPRITTVAGHFAVESVETDGVTHAALDIREVARIHDLLEKRSITTRSLLALRSDWTGTNKAASAHHCADDLSALNHARAAALSFLNAMPSDLQIRCYMAHGDLTRWNVLRAADGTARIIDWELYGLKPRWFDLLHYVISYHLLVARTPVSEILRDLRSVAQSIGATEEDDVWWRHIGLYFAYQSLYYYDVYGRQDQLHFQALWQLVAWAEILDLLRNRIVV